MRTPATQEWKIFNTALGAAGIRWSEHGVTALLLHDTDDSHLRTHLQRESGQAEPASTPPQWIQETIQSVQQHLAGQPQDFSSLPVHLPHATPFMQQVYAGARRIPPGSVVRYSELAQQIGKPAAARAVGSALGKNPVLLLIPCHRIIAAANKPGGFSSPGGLLTKQQLLALEGVALNI